MRGFKSFGSARGTIAGIETVHMIRKGELCCRKGFAFSAADRFFSLAA